MVDFCTELTLSTVLLNSVAPMYEAHGYAAARTAPKNQGTLLMGMGLVATEAYIHNNLPKYGSARRCWQ